MRKIISPFLFNKSDYLWHLIFCYISKMLLQTVFPFQLRQTFDPLKSKVGRQVAINRSNFPNYRNLPKDNSFRPIFRCCQLFRNIVQLHPICVFQQNNDQSENYEKCSTDDLSHPVCFFFVPYLLNKIVVSKVHFFKEICNRIYVNKDTILQSVCKGFKTSQIVG